MLLSRPLRRLFAAASVVAIVGGQASAFDTSARAAFVLDHTTGTVLMAKNADESLPPASMSKLMTLYMAFEAIRDGRLQLDERLPVSEHAMSYGGSTMFLNTQDRPAVEDLLRGIIVLSGNDACAVIAEALSPDGSEAGFADLMTRRAQQMGMTGSQFANASGWPDPNQRMSMRDLSLLASHIIDDFPQFYPIFAERQFAFDGRAPSNVNNRNPLLRLDIGADGLKTGHTAEAGYGLVGSAKQGDRRVIFAITGMDSERARAEQSEAIVNWAFRQFAERTLAEADTEIARADVWLGSEDSVALVARKDVTLLVPVTPGTTLDAEVVYTGPLKAPIAAGQQLAELIIRPEGLPEHRVPLFAAREVASGGFGKRMMTVSQVLFKRLQEGGASGTGEAM
ncbi:D-alanyl-D-alanine carboxypeptidase [Salipiger aestuarii]|uniref:serine-type D-Ala-D-Ala carboxypeptidase n=1 Tax=Salipiger aestuarii TaxID=568098 RepID=A0A327YME2_9RHOB|nr:D-alanyl-D-alanine carboxypeptidase family protein [Salipiger aestuarii]EIE50391.1 D-alanyl-D-alanine carboxypeptidase [Citreicella sp. 357]KAA8609334.1 D-alanyl-D-alanine carboxypeptidase [Salipiger aestuarii]KAA8615129.1 D-alanyl-D-alanine carboxypeptidase [Salipiger aestuarii]KAB2542946.1 D-alanyl-D-alanine carboxypeptidase [Salipiger aestuarii]RAK20875.1 D-alanyl-D-alanine carboxypeptidase (penicillin-binding protein 5/6) [Salipiger aestuarii]